MIEHDESGYDDDVLTKAFNRFEETQGDSVTTERYGDLELVSKYVQSQMSAGSKQINIIRQIWGLREGRVWFSRRTETAREVGSDVETTTWVIRSIIERNNFIGQINIRKSQDFNRTDDDGKIVGPVEKERMILSVFPNGEEFSTPKVYFKLSEKRDAEGRVLKPTQMEYQYDQVGTFLAFTEDPLRNAYGLKNVIFPMDAIRTVGRKVETINPGVLRGIEKVQYPQVIAKQPWMENLSNNRDNVIESESIPMVSWFKRMGIWVR